MARRALSVFRIARLCAAIGLAAALCGIVGASARPSAYLAKNGKIVFASDRDSGVAGVFELYVMDAGGSGQTRLTSQLPSSSLEPDWQAIGYSPPPPGCTGFGTSGNDTIRGTPGPDVLCGLGGNDRLLGLGGNDVLEGGPGSDTLDGGAGKDTADGGPGKDTCKAETRKACEK